jgi:hypothetical protein
MQAFRGADKSETNPAAFRLVHQHMLLLNQIRFSLHLMFT